MDKNPESAANTSGDPASDSSEALSQPTSAGEQASPPPAEPPKREGTVTPTPDPSKAGGSGEESASAPPKKSQVGSQNPESPPEYPPTEIGMQGALQEVITAEHAAADATTQAATLASRGVNKTFWANIFVALATLFLAVCTAILAYQTANQVKQASGEQDRLKAAVSALQESAQATQELADATVGLPNKPQLVSLTNCNFASVDHDTGQFTLADSTECNWLRATVENISRTAQYMTATLHIEKPRDISCRPEADIQQGPGDSGFLEFDMRECLTVATPGAEIQGRVIVAFRDRLSEEGSS